MPTGAFTAIPFPEPAPSPDPKAVPLIFLHVEDMGIDYCGGFIGTAKNRFCLNRQCSVQSHRQQKAVEVLQGKSYWVFIANGASTAAFCSPTVAPKTLGDKLAKYLAER